MWAMTIRAVLIVNNYGRPRLTKFYSPLPVDRQQALIRLIFQLVSQRDDNSVCNFLDAPELTPLLPPQSEEAWSKLRGSETSTGPSERPASDPWITPQVPREERPTRRWHPDDELRVIYRHYATLYFVLVVDQSESELGVLDLIQVFVEALDRCFDNVCELDLIFHFDQVHAILDQIIQGGLVLETNINEIVSSAQAVLKARKTSAASSPGAGPLQSLGTANASSMLDPSQLPSWDSVSLSAIASRGTSALGALQQFGSRYWGSRSASGW